MPTVPGSQPGELVTYNITLKNNGEITADNVEG
ncbi:MAG: hypothetical protein IPL49_22150 [Saprospirales bacterium]|nr:hypothetical protein [Saprospirales bacterium]